MRRAVRPSQRHLSPAPLTERARRGSTGASKEKRRGHAEERGQCDMQVSSTTNDSVKRSARISRNPDKHGMAQRDRHGTSVGIEFRLIETTFLQRWLWNAHHVERIKRTQLPRELEPSRQMSEVNPNNPTQWISNRHIGNGIPW